MRTTSRFIVTAATALTAGLALTACGSSAASSAAAGSASPVASGGTAVATAAASAGAGAGATSGGTTGGATGGADGGSTGGTSVSAAKHCTVADVKLTVQGPTAHASEQQPATASIHAVNTSGHSCTLTGFPGVRLADDQGKSSPIDAVRRQGVQSDQVTLAAGATATADLLYSDVNSQGSASGRLVCAVTGSKVAVILPNTTQQVKVPVSGGVDNGTLNVCGELTVDPFAGVQD
ncbi:DUF4232 domain-containing protein [Streptacidiphilus melanogenes]|uniref:DUF4232 domain-containing protein n=1 Tax=Streptacidiphilus melanogenes TaxID=411235 RepID=UPI0005A981FF|nr:DUF4232 domain-containing protein [Streptacidiphilus melanogenes]